MRFFKVIVLAVELMLDSADRAISDRYKLIDYKEQDNENEVSGLTDYFLTVSLPVIMSEPFTDVGVIIKSV